MTRLLNPLRAMGLSSPFPADAPSALQTISMTTLVQNGTNTDGTTSVTASISPSANKLLLAVFASGMGAWQAPTGVTGNGLTWAKISDYPVLLNGEGLSLWAAYTGASPATGAVTATYAGVQAYHLWGVIEVTNANTSNPIGSIGANTTIQATTSPSVGVSAFTDALSSTFSCCLIRQNSVFSPGAGYTQLVDVGVTHPRRIQAQFKNSPDINPTCSFTGSADFYSMIGVELRPSS